MSTKHAKAAEKFLGKSGDGSMAQRDPLDGSCQERQDEQGSTRVGRIA